MKTKQTQPFADRLTAARLKANMRPIELARAADLTPSAISKLEHGKRTRPNLETVGKLAAALGISVDQLLGVRRAAPRRGVCKKAA